MYRTHIAISTEIYSQLYKIIDNKKKLLITTKQDETYKML